MLPDRLYNLTYARHTPILWIYYTSNDQSTLQKQAHQND